MAIDTELKRRSVQNYAIGTGILPVATGTIAGPDRATLGWIYSGISYTAEINLIVLPGSHDQLATEPDLQVIIPDLNVESGSHDQIATEPSLGTALQLIPESGSHDQIATEPDLLVELQLTVESGSHDQISTEPSMSQLHKLIVVDCEHEHFATEPAFTTGVLKSCMIISDSPETCLAAINKAAVCMSISHD